MNKVILMSIRPEWLVKILNGEKTIDIRKSMPKCELPIDVYLYCTKGKPMARYEAVVQLNGVSIGSDYIYETTTENDKSAKYFVNGKVVAKFTLNKVDTVEIGDDGCVVLVNGEQSCLPKCSCLTDDEWFDYVGYGDDFSLFDSQYDKAYAWHIDNLVIFDKPKELREFYEKGYLDYIKPCEHPRYPETYKDFYKSVLKVAKHKFKLIKAPQSWQYVWWEKNEK